MSNPSEIARQVEQLDDEQWYDFLDELDAVTRRRRQRAPAQDAPAGRTRDEVAAWLAHKHLIGDSAIREVWYLPTGAAPDEIRLLEVNDRLPGPSCQAEALGFGLDLEGVNFRLSVADVSGEQMEGVKADPSRLPAGWSLADSRVWRRRP
jgi:hypothetical protein